MSSTSANTQGLAYDILSIMHYGSLSFSKNNQPTITAKSGVPLLEAYQKTALSTLDISALRLAYSVSSTVTSCYKGTTSTSITACGTAYKYCYVI